MLAAAVIAAGGAIRFCFIAQAARDRVDHHYWLQIAAAARADRRLPVKLPGKFILEDDAQAYPPFFGWFLSLFGDRFLRRHAVWLSQSADVALVVVLGVVAFALSGPAATVIVVALTALAPVLVAYNVQVNPRSWGNLFLVIMIVLDTSAAAALSLGLPEFAALAGAAVAAALVFVSHKMTTQLMLFVTPILAVALGTVWPLATLLIGLALSVAVTGPKFADSQWRAHGDIIQFWYRNWRNLGVHAFARSPIYGDPNHVSRSAFHQPGLRGVIKHLQLIVGYAPASLLLPISLLFAPAPPVWILAWTAAVYAAALLTLLVPPLKCLGGGHLYVFSAVAPAALWWCSLFAQPNTTVVPLFGLAVLLSLGALYLGWRRRGLTKNSHDTDFANLLEKLKALPPTRLAVFPLVRAEQVAAETPHAVLWGGHGYGFDRLSPVFPVVTQPLHTTFRDSAINLVVWDSTYWPEGETAMRCEGVFDHFDRHGQWCLAPVAAASEYQAQVSADG